MSPVAGSTGYCARKADICYEWSLTGNPSLRFIAYGNEQGIDYSFYKVSSGQYKQIVRVHPVLRDPRHPGVLFWAYPQDIQDISAEPKEQFLASFHHHLVDDGEVYSPKWQKRIPAVLFVGATTQPQMQLKPIKFQVFSVEALRHGAGR